MTTVATPQKPQVEEGEPTRLLKGPVGQTQLLLAFTISLYIAILVRTAWIHEDAYITLRTVRNLLDGFGPVWNVGERVQAYTHPLWMFLLAGVLGVSGEYYYTTIALCIVISVVTLYVLVFRLAMSPWAAILAILLLCFSKAYVDYLHLRPGKPVDPPATCTVRPGLLARIQIPALVYSSHHCWRV